MKTKIPFADRCLFLCVVVMLLSVGVAGRLVELQVIDSNNHGRIAADELIGKERIPARRGIIMDRNDEILTNNIRSAELVADRYHLRDLNAVVEGLAYNQASNDPEWLATEDPAVRSRILKNHRIALLKNAERDLSREEKAALRATIDTKSASANRMLDYDPEICEYYYRLHDQLVAEVIYPFLAHTEVEDDNSDETESAPAPERYVTKKVKKGKKWQTVRVKVETPAEQPRPAKRKQLITKEYLVEKIAQNAVTEYNREALARGEKPKKYRNEIVLAKGLTVDNADKISSALRAAHLRGLVVQNNLRRSYTVPEMLCHVLGYVNHENKGMSGVEAYFQSYLAGVDGMREFRRNAKGQILPNEDDRYMAPKHGLNLKLTIDMRLQTIVEQELDRGMRHFRAKRGCMIVADPHTGDILAMVSRPAFNLNTKDLITPDGSFKRGSLRESNGDVITGDFNFACQTRYEPGSTFKVIAVTSAVDKNILNIHSVVGCSPFSVGGGSKPINDGRFNYGALPVWGVLAKSSNPGAAHIALAAKWANYKEYVSRYGLDKPVDIDLPAGGACLLADGSNIVNFSRIAYGYSVSVSPLHMAMVYCTIANGGRRMKPRLIDSMINADGSIYQQIQPQEACRVMSEKTAKDLCFALESVTQKKNPNGVNRGTATAAAIPGFRIGGKTGTAKKVKEGGGYFDNLYTVSFCGVLPIDNPRLVVMTVIDEPHPTDCNPGGGTVAAPIFRAAAERFINILNLTPSDPEAYENYLAHKNDPENADRQYR